MEELLEYLPEEYFETKKDDESLYYHPPDDEVEFLKHYQSLYPVRMYVDEIIESEGLGKKRLTVLGVWADRVNTVEFVKSDFEMLY